MTEKVIFRVRELQNNLSEIIKIDCSDNTSFELEKGGYLFKLNHIGLEVTETSNNTVTSVIIKNRNLVPLCNLLNYKMVVGSYDLAFLVEFLNRSQSDVIFEIVEYGKTDDGGISLRGISLKG